MHELKFHLKNATKYTHIQILLFQWYRLSMCLLSTKRALYFVLGYIGTVLHAMSGTILTAWVSMKRKNHMYTFALHVR